MKFNALESIFPKMLYSTRFWLKMDLGVYFIPQTYNKRRYLHGTRSNMVTYDGILNECLKFRASSAKFRLNTLTIHINIDD